jgi:uncharacterized protein YdhG (YjbR/CyaY superfamily)
VAAGHGLATPIDDYLAKIANPAAKKALTALRSQLKKLLPRAAEELSYGMPAFRLENGKVAAGFAFFGRSCGYYPHSGNVVRKVRKELAGYDTSVGGVKFPPDKPLPQAAVKALVKARLAEIARAKPARKRATKAPASRRAKRAPARLRPLPERRKIG